MNNFDNETKIIAMAEYILDNKTTIRGIARRRIYEKNNLSRVWRRVCPRKRGF